MVSPRFSFVIPVYNGESVIGDALRSAQAQTEEDIEIVVVDDASTDATRDVILELASSDRRIVPILLEKNVGAAEARNIALARAVGEYIAFLDGDDIALPDRLAIQGRYLDETQDVGAVGSAVEQFGDDSGVITPVLGKDDVAACQLFSCEFYMPAMTARRRDIDGLRFVPEYQANCDWLYFNEVIRRSGVANLPNVLTKYRRWGAQMTASIVDTPYCLASRLRSDQLAWFGIHRGVQDISAHITCSPCYWPLKIDLSGDVMSDRRVERWLDTVAKTNERVGRFPASSISFAIERAARCWEQRRESLVGSSEKV